MGWFKQLVLNQIRGAPLKESNMINAWFRLLKFPNNHFHEMESWLAHYGGKIYYFSFLDIFPFGKYTNFLFGHFSISLETNQLFRF